MPARLSPKEACVVSKPGSSMPTSSSTIKSEEGSEAKFRRAATYDEDDFEQNSNVQPTKDLVLLRQVISPQDLPPTSHRRVLGTRCPARYSLEWSFVCILNHILHTVQSGLRTGPVPLHRPDVASNKLFSAARVRTRLMNLRLPDTDGVQEAVYRLARHNREVSSSRSRLAIVTITCTEGSDSGCPTVLAEAQGLPTDCGPAASFSTGMGICTRSGNQPTALPTASSPFVAPTTNGVSACRPRLS
ncbi:hypothetical protein BU17DRAFT_68094 [Hysterangium stoloniferum]|nr:hypothetical protein BU17DRAFT_68094 [Hysterangium stoloniferum]